MTGQSVVRSGYKGEYTGWMKNGTMNGRGTYISDFAGSRVDCIWKDGMRHGTGRVMESDGGFAVQGTFANDNYSSPMTRYRITGEEEKIL